jgi:malate permease and related proteins
VRGVDVTPFQQLLSAILSIMVIYFIAVVLKRRGVLEEKHSIILARVVTDVCLPAIVFTGLAAEPIEMKQLEPAGVMLALELTFVAIAWVLTTVLRFDRSVKGAVVFTSAFGSSTFLGYSIITQMYPGNEAALGEAVLISELGVGYPIFILGPILAAYFGSGRSGWKASVAFFRSPVFFALIAGLSWSMLGLPGAANSLTAPLFDLAKVLSGALTPLAILSVGLMFRRPSVRAIILPLAAVISLKLILKPLVASAAASVLGFPDLWHDVLVILAAMPPAVLGVVFLKRYGGNGELASALLLSATLVSALTILFVFRIVGF